MNLDSKTISIILAIAIQSVSLVWFISKMDSRIANNKRNGFNGGNVGLTPNTSSFVSSDGVPTTAR
jgi:hypothetical protein